MARTARCNLIRGGRDHPNLSRGGGVRLNLSRGDPGGVFSIRSGSHRNVELARQVAPHGVAAQ
eukprot:5465360-Prymnesium_polylepis.2